MVFIIDRFEGDYAVCEDENRKMINIELKRIPKEAKEGDVLKKNGDKIILDLKETQKRKTYIKKLSEDIWK
ncbi:DUF3006 domain-containing protein [Clostridium oryzae]|uniref:Uncharacterized protein n=1 Tax=Clostridium oryzae TaxID=1450648 RepID=A0A1V4IKG4_9CLOT|nr:DUF3006 domain-containing protein [Clostridium oryzae]OPJ60314.1 hypothetical protein CLORY_28890 [Clostridium oryzae]